MSAPDQTTYRIDAAGVVRPATRRIEAKRRAHRKAHSLVVQVTDGRGRVPAIIKDLCPDWWYDCRRGRNTIYGGLLRAIDVMILAHVPTWMLRMIPGFIAEYINDQAPADDAPPVPAMPARRTLRCA